MRTVTSAPIEALCWQPGGAAGVRRHAILAEAGHYFRHLPCRIDASEIEPWALQYPPLGDASLQRTRQVVCYEINDAVLTSQGCIVTRDHHIIRESLGDLLKVGGLRLRGLRPLDETSHAFEQVEEPSRTVSVPSLLLKRPWWRNFGHWLLEAAAPLALMRARGLLEPDLHLVTGRFEEPAMIATVAASLGALWPWPNPTVLQHDDDEVVRFDRLFYTTPVHDYICQEPATVQALRHFMAVPPMAQGPRRIFIERTTSLRRLVNQDEVRDLCIAYGCQPVQPVKYSLPEQVRLFRDAEVIVGIKGSDFVNAMFCAPWATLVVLSPADFPDPMVWDLSAHGPLNYFELYGALVEILDVTGRNPFAISLHKLMAIMDEACAPIEASDLRNRKRYSMQHWMAHGYMPWLDDLV